MFRPRDSYDQRLLSAPLDVDPQPASVRWMHDVFGNCVAQVAIPRQGARAPLRDPDPARAYAAGRAGFPDRRRTPLDLSVRLRSRRGGRPRRDDPARTTPTATRSRPGRGASSSPARRTETGRLLMTLCFAIHESFVYARRPEHGTQPPRLTLQLRRGTCRDFALLMMEAVRCARLRRALRHRLLYVAGRDGTDDPRRRLHPRLVPGLSAGRRLGRVRPDQRHRRQPRPDPRRRGPRPAARRCRSPAAIAASPRISTAMTVQVNVTTEAGSRRSQRDAGHCGTIAAAMRWLETPVAVADQKGPTQSCGYAPDTNSLTTARSRRRCCWR